MAQDDFDADDGVTRWFYGGTPPEDSQAPAPAMQPAPAWAAGGGAVRDSGADELLAQAWATATLHRLRGATAVRPS